MEYKFSEIEKKWQAYWEAHRTFKTEDDFGKPKYYVLDMFPYPSGSGLHVGHPEGYTATDIIARYKRMKGFNVLHPMGWDAFGLPAEQYAIETGTHPAITTSRNCDNFRRQIQSLGLGYDWDREVNTTDPAYFKWTQWIFIRLYNTWFDENSQKGRPIEELPIPEEIKQKGLQAVAEYQAAKRLAYYDNARVWWCPHCRIVCANEEVLNDGSHEKCGNMVEKKDLKQWMLRIPLYAERLLDGLKSVDWPEGVKDMQRNWIGRSTGAEVDFRIENSEEKLRVYTTRPDTLFGATYMVLAPEHEMLGDLVTPGQKEEVERYVNEAGLKSDIDRSDLSREKTGVFTGRYAINPVNGDRIPIWVADYVLTGYGTGAIMAVPAHDTRDFEFASTFSLPIPCILDPLTEDETLREEVRAGKACWTGDGRYINSSSEKTGLDINGLGKEEGIARTTAWLEEKGLGNAATNYKIRDWLFSRQRYWGEPFPVIHWEDGEISLLEDEELALQLPELEKYEPGSHGESPLANAGKWLHVEDKNGRKGRRETNTMPQWAGSCWYYLRYIDPKNDQAPFSAEKEQYWMPVDLYVGGAEHAVLHLLYSRFWHKVLFDLGIVSTDEPYSRLFNQGMILAFAYETAAGAKVPSDLVTEKDGKFFHSSTKEELKQIVAKMSKSLKNVVNPDDVVAAYGADSLRLYEMFMGPLDAVKPWAENGVKGVYNFLNRVHRFFADRSNYHHETEDSELMKSLHATIKKVGQDIEDMHFNTAISQMMIFSNLCSKKGRINHESAKAFIRILAPFAPHLAEELWELAGEKESVALAEWPAYDESLLQENSFEYPVMINGKLRFKIELPVDLPKAEAMEKALSHETARKWIDDKAIRDFIYIRGKIINIVA
ncbi:MAG: leucine--tRNA ligase [Bacteroidetes bacterium]|nr:MAG: leucine--tRNA ligase [Bacteroidota bacterium]